MNIAPTKLASRIRWLLILFALAVTLIFTGAGWILLLQSEDLIQDQHLRAQLQKLAKTKEPSPGIQYFQSHEALSQRHDIKTPPTAQGLYEFFADENGKNTVFIESGIDQVKRWLSQPPREHEYRLWYEAEQKLWIVADLENKEFTEASLSEIQSVLILLAIAVIALAFLASFLITRWALRPMLKLASDIREEKFSPEGFADDEIGYLAEVLADYNSRQKEFVQREQRFISDCSHELRTPVAILNSSVDLLKDLPDDPTRRDRILARIARSGKRMQRLTQTFLVIARNNQTRAATEEVNLHHLLQEVITELRALHPHHLLTIEVSIPPESQIHCYRESLLILCHNIIGNAFSHLEQGHLVIEESRTSQELSLHFTDNGPGNQNPEKKSSGYGIGLSLVERLCQSEDWQFHQKANIPQGTQTQIKIPNS